MNTRKQLGTSVLSVALVLSTGIPGLAWSSHTRKVTLSHQVILAGTTLPAGKYAVAWKTHSPEATVKFMQNHQVLLSTEGIVQKRDRTFKRNEIVYNASSGMVSLMEIRFAGTNQALVFNP